MFWSLLMIVFAVLVGCSTTTIDKPSLQTSKIKTIAIIIGSDTRGRAAVLGGRGYPFGGFSEEILKPVSVDLENKLNNMALGQIKNKLTNKGYTIKHIKTISIEWDLYANISDSQSNYTNLLRQYAIPAWSETFDAILFVEYMLRPRTWGAQQISALTLENFETMYAKSKMWLYEPRTGNRLFFSSTQRGYDQVLTHVKPADAFSEILVFEAIPGIPLQ